MALHVLRIKLISERVLRCHLVKGISPLQGRDNTVPLMRNSFIFGCPPGAKSPLYREAAYSLYSPWKAQSGSVLTRGRSFSSSPPHTENIPKMNSCKSSSASGTEMPSVSGQCKSDCSRHEIDELVYKAQVFGLWSACLSFAFGLYNLVQLNSAYKVLDALK